MDADVVNAAGKWASGLLFFGSVFYLVVHGMTPADDYIGMGATALGGIGVHAVGQIKQKISGTPAAAPAAPPAG